MRNPHKIPRVAYCTGCNETFKKTHYLINHRRSVKCGGRYLPQEVRERLDILRQKREAEARELRKIKEVLR